MGPKGSEMKYKIYIRDNMVSGAPVVVLEIDNKVISQDYCMTRWGARWKAYHLNARVLAGKFTLNGNLYEGTIK